MLDLLIPVRLTKVDARPVVMYIAVIKLRGKGSFGAANDAPGGKHPGFPIGSGE